MTEDAADTDDEDVNPTFDLDSSMMSITFSIETVIIRQSSSWCLCFQLAKQLNLGDTMTAELAAMMIGASDKAVHDWRS